MLTDSKLRSTINSLWDKFASGGLSNPLDAIEQLSYLLFLKRLDDEEQNRQRTANLRGLEYVPLFADKTLQWSYWTNLAAGDALKHVKEKVFPTLKTVSGEGSSFELQMENAEFKINKPALLIEACKTIDEMQISQQNQDVQGDIYEFFLDRLKEAGRYSFFRTPRHIIRMVVQMIEPKRNERICDPIAGTGGFLVNAYKFILENNTSKKILKYDDEGLPHNLMGDLLDERSERFLQTESLTGFDSDSSMSLVRIGAMNLMMHGIKRPRFYFSDTLSKHYAEVSRYDVVLAGDIQFKGTTDPNSIGEGLPATIKKTELLFIHLFLRMLESGGRCAAIVPDGVLFGSSNAHVSTRKKLIEENKLEAVISMPSGVFKPYAGVSTAILFFTKNGTTDKVWFYDMKSDGFSLDDKRQKTLDNDIPDILECWNNRKSADFHEVRQRRLTALKTEVSPLKLKRLELHKLINRLTFESVIAAKTDETPHLALETEAKNLADLEEQIKPLQNEIDQLTRQFYVSKSDIQTNKYDLSASRYRQIEADAGFYEEPNITLERLMTLEDVMKAEVRELQITLV